MIDKFDGTDHEFLSNFHKAVIWFDSRPWATVEHAYQACKVRDQKVKAAIAAATEPGQAKRLGQTVDLREDWDEVKVGDRWVNKKDIPGYGG